LANAAGYVVSLIPPPIAEGDIRTDWLYVPSAQLGGDSLGYHWIDDAHFAIYLLDVSGHGIGPALLSVSVLNTLRRRSLPETDFLRPDRVLSALNSSFPMKEQNGQYFTIWYGVFDRRDRMLRYASGGHPPALLFDGSGAQPVELDTQSLPIGLFPEAPYCPAAVRIRPASSVYLYSDGCYEVQKSDGAVGTRQEWVRHLSPDSSGRVLHLDDVYRDAITAQRGERLADDFSILRATFA
jgi:sigma-B regulation protein RsbU (phosphoserine phosphatase)